MKQSFGGHRPAVAKLVFPTGASISPNGLRIAGIAFYSVPASSGLAMHPQRRVELKKPCAGGAYAPLDESRARSIALQNDAMLSNEAQRRMETLFVKIRKNYDYGPKDFNDIGGLISQLSGSEHKVMLFSTLLFLSLHAHLPRRFTLSLVSDLSDLAAQMESKVSQQKVLDVLNQIFAQMTLCSRVEPDLRWKLIDSAQDAWRLQVGGRS